MARTVEALSQPFPAIFVGLLIIRDPALPLTTDNITWLYLALAVAVGFVIMGEWMTRSTERDIMAALEAQQERQRDNPSPVTTRATPPRRSRLSPAAMAVGVTVGLVAGRALRRR